MDEKLKLMSLIGDLHTLRERLPEAYRKALISEAISYLETMLSTLITKGGKQ